MAGHGPQHSAAMTIHVSFSLLSTGSACVMPGVSGCEGGEVDGYKAHPGQSDADS